jgi:RND superfamily putative drug exporter
MARRHYSAEQMFSWTCMVRGDGIADEFGQAVEYSRALAELCLGSQGVTDVWHLGEPLGAGGESAMAAMARTDVGRRQAAPYYIAPEANGLRVEVMTAAEPMSAEAMASCRGTLERVRAWAEDRFGEDARVYATGLTPYILNIKSVSDRDQSRVMVLVFVVILLVVYAMVRDFPLATVMLAATVLVYIVTIGVTYWFFTTVTGSGGIDWKVKLFTFVILVAVGQDYNIFLVSRLRHERRSFDAREATRRAIAGTGSVISGCGAIMAATLGSLAATGVPFFQQLGLAFAFGVLVDTFIIRPVLVPGAYLLLKR